MSQTPRLALPFLAVGQAQKEFTHNEALQTIDVLVGGCVEGPPQPTPPSAPAIGSAYLVSEAATDAWAGQGGAVAAWTSGGWRFINPPEGMQLLDRASGTFSTFRGGAWDLGGVQASSVQVDGMQVVGSRQAAIDPPSGGSTVDVEARASVAAILAALQAHGLIEA